MDPVDRRTASDGYRTGQRTGYGQGLGRPGRIGGDVDLVRYLQGSAIHRCSRDVADIGDVRRHAYGRSAGRSGDRAGKRVDPRVVAGIDDQVLGRHRTTADRCLGRVADLVPARRTLQGHVAGGTHRHCTGQDLGLVRRTHGDLVAGNQSRPAAAGRGDVADVIDGQCRTDGHLRADRRGAGQGTDEGIVAGSHDDAGGVQRGLARRRFRPHRNGGVVGDRIVGSTTHAGEIAGAATDARADGQDLRLLARGQADTVAAGSGDGRITDADAVAVLDGVVSERDAGVVVAELGHARHRDDRTLGAAVAANRLYLGVAAAGGISVGVHGNVADGRTAVINARPRAHAIGIATAGRLGQIAGHGGPRIDIQVALDVHGRAAADARFGRVGDLVHQHRACQTHATLFPGGATAGRGRDDARGIGGTHRDILHAIDLAAGDGGTGAILDIGIRHRRAKAGLASGVQCAAAIGDLGFIDCGDGHVLRRARDAGDLAALQLRGGLVPGHGHRGRHRRRDRGALVAGRIDAHAQADVDLLALIARAHFHCAGITHVTLHQARGGVVADIAVGHATGNRCTALVVVRVGRRHRQRAADAHQQGLVDRGDVQLQALAGDIVEHRVGHVGAGLLLGPVDRCTARHRDTELRLRGLPSTSPPITTAKLLLGLAEVAAQRAVAAVAGLACHCLQPVDFLQRAALERVQEARVLLAALLGQLFLEFVELAVLARGDRAGGGDRTRQASAAGCNLEFTGVDRTRAANGATGSEVLRDLPDEGMRVGRHLLVGHAGADRQTVAHRHRTGHRPDEQVLVCLDADRCRSQGGLVADAGQRPAAQVQCRRRAVDAIAATQARLQGQRNHLLLARGIHRDVAARSVDHHPVIDDGRSGVLVIGVAHAAAHGHTGIAHGRGLEVLQAQVTGRMQGGHVDVGGDAGRRVIAARACPLLVLLLAAVVKPIERRSPCIGAAAGRGQLGTTGHVRARSVARLEVADRRAQRKIIGRATCGGVRGEQVRRIGDQVLGSRDRCLERIEATEVRRCVGQRREVLGQVDVRSQADALATDRRAASNQCPGIVREVGNGHRAGQREGRAIVILALGDDVADRMVGDLRVHHLAVHHHIAGGIDGHAAGGVVADAGAGGMLATDEADGTAQAERRRLGRLGRGRVVLAIIRQCLHRLAKAGADQRLGHGHQPVLALADQLDLFLARLRLRFRRAHQRVGLVDRRDAGGLDHHITRATAVLGGRHAAIQPRFGRDVLQADRTGQANVATLVRACGGRSFQRGLVDRRHIKRASVDLRGAGTAFDQRLGAHVDVADRRGEGRRGVVDRDRLGRDLHRGGGVGLDREIATGLDLRTGTDDRLGCRVDLPIRRAEAEQLPLLLRLAGGRVDDRLAGVIQHRIVRFVLLARRRVVHGLAGAGMQVDALARFQRRRVLHLHPSGGGAMQHRDLFAQHLVHACGNQRFTEADQVVGIGDAVEQVRFQVGQDHALAVIPGIDDRLRAQLDVIGLQHARPARLARIAAHGHRRLGTAHAQSGVGDGRGAQLDLAAGILLQLDLGVVAAGVHRGLLMQQVERATARGLHQDRAGHIDGAGLHPHPVLCVDLALDVHLATAVDLFGQQRAGHQAIQGPAAVEDVIHDTGRRRGHRQCANIEHAALVHHHAHRVDEEHAPGTDGIGAVQHAVDRAIDVDA